MKIESHEKRLKESLEVIGENIKRDLAERQRNIGFNTSAAAIDMLEILLHKTARINPGFIIKHSWFNSEKHAAKKLSFSFPRKEEIIKLITLIEAKRNNFCYGSPQPRSEIEKVLDAFSKLVEEFRLAEKEIG